MFTPKKIIVTGAAGFIGSTFVAGMAERGIEVVVLDALTYAGHRENLEWIPSGWQLVVGNICDGKLVAELLNKHKPDALLNFAAESHVDNSINNPAEFVNTNVVGTYTLLQASLEYWRSLADKNSFRYLQVSTDEVYGSLGETGKFSETTPYQPNSPYSASKAGGDMLVRAWHETYGLPTITTNCTNNYGARQHPEKLIPHMITCALNEKPLPVYGDGKNIRDWIHVADHGAGIYLALTKGKAGETYCFGGNSERNNLDVVNAICNALDVLRPRANGKKYNELITFVTDRLGHDRRYAIDDSKAVKELGYTRQYNTFEDGLHETINWYLQNGKWCESVMKKAA